MVQNSIVSPSVKTNGLVNFMPWLVIGILFLGVLISAILGIYMKHLSRQLFAELQNLEKSRDELHVEWSQLLLEQGAWASDARVERFAREKLEMALPKPEKVVIVH